MYEIRCTKCKTKILEVSKCNGTVVLDVWCRKTNCKTKTKFVIVDGDVIARVNYILKLESEVKKDE